MSWSHTRFATPLLGIALVAFVSSRCCIARRRVARSCSIAALLLLRDLRRTSSPARSSSPAGARGSGTRGSCAYPFATGKGIYTTAQNADELAALNGFVDRSDRAPILDFSNERALYYFLRRKPPLRCFDIPMLSAPPLLAEAMARAECAPARRA